jgi:hypothetical protein
MEPTAVPLSGRRAQAARNDQRILEAARAAFVADADAPIAAVAERAGVGIGGDQESPCVASSWFRTCPGA